MYKNELRKIFDYDFKAPLEFQEASVTAKENIKIHDISFAGTGNTRITAFLVVPHGQGPFAGTVFLHGGAGNRFQFLDEATILAQLGVLSLLIEMPYEGSRDYVIQCIINLRRSVDLLLSMEGVNADKLCYVGHSWGATLGGILAGVEKRFNAFILMAGFPAISKHERYYYGSDMDQLDSIHYIGHAAPSSLLFQFAENDVFMTKDEAIQFYENCSAPKLIKWYKTDHNFNEEARKFRLEWIKKTLDI